MATSIRTNMSTMQRRCSQLSGNAVLCYLFINLWFIWWGQTEVSPCFSISVGKQILIFQSGRLPLSLKSVYLQQHHRFERIQTWSWKRWKPQSLRSFSWCSCPICVIRSPLSELIRYAICFPLHVAGQSWLVVFIRGKAEGHDLGLIVRAVKHTSALRNLPWTLTEPSRNVRNLTLWLLYRLYFDRHWLKSFL